MPQGERRDPYLGFHFRIVIDGIDQGGFAECAGLEVQTEMHEYREGGVNTYIHRFTGPSKHPPLVLKRGLIDAATLWDWHQEVVHGTVTRRNVSIDLRDARGESVVQWDFEMAFPVKWTGPSLKADSGEVALETLELVHRGFKRAS